MADAASVYFADAFYDGQFARTLYKAYAGAADLGEAFATARRLGPRAADADRWHDGWRAMADAVASNAEGRDRVGARDGYLRASEYYRQAYFFLRGTSTTSGYTTRTSGTSSRSPPPWR
jgi:hypothetical protein